MRVLEGHQIVKFILKYSRYEGSFFSTSYQTRKAIDLTVKILWTEHSIWLLRYSPVNDVQVQVV